VEEEGRQERGGERDAECLSRQKATRENKERHMDKRKIGRCD
jgi:hypothetical protein